MSLAPQYPANFPTRIAFVGEAPGSTDMDKGYPFAGSTGNVLNAMLRTANLDRREFFIGHLFDTPKSLDEIKSLKREAIQDASDRLTEELRIAAPNIIVPMGPTALWAFTGDTSIGSQRGSIQPAKYILPGAKLLPTYHPGFVQKHWKFFSVVTADFIRAYREGAYREIRLPIRELLIEPTVQEIRDYLPRLFNSQLMSVDIETGWGLVTNLGFAPDREHAINIPFVDVRKPNKSFYSTADEIEVWKLVKEIMESETPKLGQNFGGYDAYWFIDQMQISPRNFIHDTRLIHHALYPELPKDLEFMGASYTEQGAWKSWGRKSQEKRES